MALRKIFSSICLVISTFCLAAGYGFSGQWLGATIATASGLAWLSARKYPRSWPLNVCLTLSVGLAVMGLLTGVPPVLMIFGAGFALAMWDLLLLDGEMGSRSAGEQSRRYEVKHLQSLALALGAGLLAAVPGGMLKLQVPFVAMLLFVALIIFGLDRIWRTLTKRSAP